MAVERPKPRGPLLWLAGRPRWFWIATAVLALLYVLSSGPMTKIAWRGRQQVIRLQNGLPLQATYLDVSGWWKILYAPLWQVSLSSWGDPINAYWRLFPLRIEPPAKPSGDTNDQ